MQERHSESRSVPVILGRLRILFAASRPFDVSLFVRQCRQVLVGQMSHSRTAGNPETSNKISSSTTRQGRRIKTTVGNTGGREDLTNPSYKDVCSGRTSHAEAVRFGLYPAIVSFAELVGKCAVVRFPHLTDGPTQNPSIARMTRRVRITVRIPLFQPHIYADDFGARAEYRSAIFTHSPEQMATAKRVTEQVQAAHFTRRS